MNSAPARTSETSRPPGNPALSIVIPVYNEEDNIHLQWEALRKALAGIKESYEIIFVNDGSTDGTASRLQETAAADPHVRVLQLSAHTGQSAAFEAGFQASRGEWVVTMDGDLQNDPLDIITLLACREQADAVCGVRERRNDNWIRRLSSRIGNAARNVITQEEITDTGCSLKVLRGDIVRRIRFSRGLHRFIPTLMKMEGAHRILEVPVRHQPRRAGASKYGIRNRLWAGLRDCFGVRWMKSRHHEYTAMEMTPSWGDPQRAQEDRHS
ncbi:MAG: glycosyltransferase family 2 protein [Candidatus Eisenbacteria bacterium]|uniref:Glycosyltransferase family 2 protein n=1 Tax=Eiseniibacteriota bacterium TaxID=2212470 RepID=A0A948RV12_UNCEI|nr:glycosyltransferase family 2 protein [Candidatus Eisenbacteria bacterium]MBU1950007.1 glycosyltransferase family 2 protein [Candidatus Eisenbacteria bacterium]MBU2691041.1 glycosyltransferase family 2 protein [Candidatus Eisenbacteria bacterium]